MIHRELFRVGMESVDALGIVYFARYWDWFEQCFEAFVSEAAGRSWKEVVESGIAMPIVHCEIDYREPVYLSEVITVELALVRVGPRSVRFAARYLNESGASVAEAMSVHVPVTRDMSRAEIPSWLDPAVERDPFKRSPA